MFRKNSLSESLMPQIEYSAVCMPFHFEIRFVSDCALRTFLIETVEISFRPVCAVCVFSGSFQKERRRIKAVSVIHIFHACAVLFFAQTSSLPGISQTVFCAVQLFPSVLFLSFFRGNRSARHRRRVLVCAFLSHWVPFPAVLSGLLPRKPRRILQSRGSRRRILRLPTSGRPRHRVFLPALSVFRIL